jgi:uncharacterized membrane protein
VDALEADLIAALGRTNGWARYAGYMAIIDLALILLALFCMGALYIRHRPRPPLPPPNPIGFQ